MIEFVAADAGHDVPAAGDHVFDRATRESRIEGATRRMAE
jgi:hypothetical protein